MTTAITQTAALPTLTSQNAARIYLASLQSEKSRQTMEQALGVIAHVAIYGAMPPDAGEDATRAARQAGAADLRSLIDAVPWVEFDTERARSISAVLRASYQARSYNKSIAALRGTLKAAVSQVRDAGRSARLAASSTYELMRLAVLSQDRQDSLNDAIGALKTVNVAGKGRDQATGRMLTLGELMALIAACQDGTNAGARDAALLAVAYSCGLRRDELANVTVADYNPADGALTVTHGKGDKTRQVYVTNGAKLAVEDWLQKRGSAAGAIFVHVGKGDRLTGRKMTDQGIYTILQDMAAGASVTDFTPHDLRRTYVSTLLDNGVDLATVQKLAGHSSPSTTAAYDRRGERAKKDAAGKLHFPYQHKDR